MPLPTGVVWPRDAHTQAKHALLREYLKAWYPILLQAGFRTVTYAEGFAGPGVYEGGEPGSPLVALKVFLRHRVALEAEQTLNVVLVEERGDRRARLGQELDSALKGPLAPRPAGLRLHVATGGDCKDALLPALDAVGSFRQPIFAFLDSFGGPDVPRDVLTRVAANTASEVLVTFGPNFLVRFGEMEEHADAGDEAFGDTTWRDVFEQPPTEKKRYLVTRYRESLHDAGFKFTTVFELVDEQGQAIYLMFGTNNRRGLEVMKDAMWKVDRAYGIRYRDPRDPSQTLLEFDLDPQIATLGRMLVEQIQDGQRTVGELRDFALLETVYRPQHVPPAVRELIAKGHAEQVDAGRLGRKSTIRLASGKSTPIEDTLF
jgi:three-Cys-motif partner protein